MKEFLAGFQVDTEHKELAGVCAGLGNYFNIQANIVRAVCLILVSLGTEGLTAIFESGKDFGQWLVGLV